LLKAVRYEDGVLRLIDQRVLPGEVRIIACRTHRDVALAIREMAVRGAPAIGIAAAYGLALAAREAVRSVEPGQGAGEGRGRDRAMDYLREAAESLRRTRPTAVNLAWAVERMLSAAACVRGGPEEIAAALEREAAEIDREDAANNLRIAGLGSDLVPSGATVLTHCNAGALATGGHGTALGIIRAAWEQGKLARVYADETRPLLQGARLTAWELVTDGIPVTVVPDNMAGYLMKLKRVDLVIVGADRIAANGDVANKIGTYGLAVLARQHGLPFYVAAPWSTVDLKIADGEAIPIEERPAVEVTHFAGVRVVPEGATVFNPAFDVTPAELITAIVTERGIVRPPLGEGLRTLEGDAVDDRPQIHPR
jgi:methylthioribose-1-phosphate isomerase